MQQQNTLSMLNAPPRVWTPQEFEEMMNAKTAQTNVLNIGLPNSITPKRNPLNDYNWQLPYYLNDFADKYFGISKTLRFGEKINFYFNDDPNNNQPNEEELYTIIKEWWILYTDTNHNDKFDFNKDIKLKNLLDIKIFMSKDGAWLLETSQKLGTLKDDELAIFLEYKDNDKFSDNVLLIRGGKTASTYFNDKKFVGYLNAKTKISKTELVSFIKNCNNQNTLVNSLKGLISGLTKLLTTAPEQIGKFLIWIGEQIDFLHIEKAHWNLNITTPLVDFVANIEQKINGLLTDIINTEGIKLWELWGYVAYIPFPNFVIETLQTLRTIITNIFTSINTFLKALGNSVEVIFAVLCGIINGIVDLISGLFSFVGLILKFMAKATNATIEFAQNQEYYIPLALEYFDNFFQGIAKIDWLQVFTHTIEWCTKIYNEIDINNIDISKNEIAYYTAYIVINVAACFTGLGEIAAITRLAKLEGTISKLFAYVNETISTLPKGLKQTAEGLLSVLSAYVGVIYKGTTAVLQLIDQIFAAIFKWLKVKNTGATEEEMERMLHPIQEKPVVVKAKSKQQQLYEEKQKKIQAMLEKPKKALERRKAYYKWNRKFKKFYQHFDGEIIIREKMNKATKKMEEFFDFVGAHNHHVIGTKIQLGTIRKPPRVSYHNLPKDVPFIANVELKYKTGVLQKKGTSSFFPKNWSDFRIKEEICYIYEQALKSGKQFNYKNNKFEYLNSEGSFKVIIEFDEVGFFTNAYPSIKI